MKYLRCLEPIQSPEDFQRTKSLVEQFGSSSETIGHQLQRMLIAHADKSENYVCWLMLIDDDDEHWSSLGGRLVVRRYVFGKFASIADQFESSFCSSAADISQHARISQVGRGECFAYVRCEPYVFRFVAKLISGILDYKVLIDG
jgi:hypothetical protein